MLASFGIDHLKIALSGAMSSRITTDIVLQQYRNLKPQNNSYVILTEKILLCVLYEKLPCNKHKKVGVLSLPLRTMSVYMYFL